MADVQMPESIPCRFDAKGWRPCKKPSTNGWCSEHEAAICSSCGKHAVRHCDVEMGSLACGAYLCETCEHNPDHGDDHVTQEVAQQYRDKQQQEELARAASRTSADQRMHPELDVPLNLFELLKGDLAQQGFVLTKIYYLKLEHGLMGLHPAIFSRDEHRIVITTDLQTLETVWESLDPRRSSVQSRVAYVNASRGIMYMDAEFPEEREERCPERILTSSELKSLFESEEGKLFRWAPGVVGDMRWDRDFYLRTLAGQAKALDPSFQSSYCPS